MTTSAKVLTLRLWVIAWITFTAIALLGMFHLWWTRERPLYAGKTASEQRRTIFRQIGWSPDLADAAGKLEGQLNCIHYTPEGDRNTLSYIIYLLAPAIPSSQSPLTIQTDGTTLSARGGELQPAASSTEPRPNPLGFLLSVALIMGIATLIMHPRVHARIASWPESSAMAVMLAGAAGIGARALGFHAGSGFAIASGIALLGWIAFPEVLRRSRHAPPASPSPTASNTKRSFRRALSATGAITITLAGLWSLLMAVVVVPDDWDAWATWGAKAKIIALGTGPLSDITWFGHADYPLLWPSLWAFSGWCSGGWEEQWSKGWGSLLMLLCAWRMAQVIRESRTDSPTHHSWLFPGIFLSMPAIPLIASWGYAEPMLWLMTTCAFGRLIRWSQSRRPVDLLLAGIFTAAAAHCKNEGMAFALVSTVWILLHHPTQRLRALAAYTVPIAVLVSPWIIWTRFLHRLPILTTGGLDSATSTLPHLWHRLLDSAPAIVHVWADPRQWNIVLWTIPIGLAWTLTKHASPSKSPSLIPIGMLLTSLAMILLGQNDPAWLVGTAWNRLTAQVMPMALIIIGISAEGDSPLLPGQHKQTAPLRMD